MMNECNNFQHETIENTQSYVIVLFKVCTMPLNFIIKYQYSSIFHVKTGKHKYIFSKYSCRNIIGDVTHIILLS